PEDVGAEPVPAAGTLREVQDVARFRIRSGEQPWHQTHRAEHDDQPCGNDEPRILAQLPYDVTPKSRVGSSVGSELRRRAQRHLGRLSEMAIHTGSLDR